MMSSVGVFGLLTQLVVLDDCIIKVPDTISPANLTQIA